MLAWQFFLFFSLSPQEAYQDILKHKLFKLSDYAAISRQHLDLSLVITSCRVNLHWLTLDNWAYNTHERSSVCRLVQLIVCVGSPRMEISRLQIWLLWNDASLWWELNKYHTAASSHLSSKGWSAVLGWLCRCGLSHQGQLSSQASAGLKRVWGSLSAREPRQWKVHRRRTEEAAS